MSTRSVLLVVALLVAIANAANLDPCEGITPETWQQVTPPWSEVFESQYPLGYKTAIIKEDNNPPFCMNVGSLPLDSVAKKKVEIMIETQATDARICVKDNSNSVSTAKPGAIVACGNGRVHACFPSETNADIMKLVFYCDTGCLTSTLSFWYRVRVSTQTWTDSQSNAMTNLEMWCMMQDTLPDTRFPSDLMADEPEKFPATNTVGAASSAAQPVFAVAAIVAAIALLF